MSDFPLSFAGCTFDWDDANRNHLARHKVFPHEAEELFRNAPIERQQQQRGGEHRSLFEGESNAGRILNLVATMRGGAIRVVTAWDASREARASYLAAKGRAS